MSHSIALTVASILRRAERRAGVADFGHADFRKPLELLMADVAGPSGLHAFGRAIVREDCVRHLVNRLRIQAAITTQPSIARRPVDRPVMILSLPRTGTTLLYNLLACHRALRAPLLAELLAPVPDSGRSAIRRTRRARRLIRITRLLMPGVSRLHPLDAAGPEEAGFLLKNACRSYLYCVTAHLPTYRRFLDGSDMTAACRYLRLQLQAMQGESTPRWLLKSPEFACYPAALAAVFPDAALIRIHREPVALTASLCRLAETMRRPLTLHLDRDGIGRDALDSLSLAAGRLAAQAVQPSCAPVIDLAFDRLMADPVGTAGDVAARLGLAHDDTFVPAMRAWLTAHPHRPARKRPRLDDYGLRAADVNAALLRPNPGFHA